MCEQCLDRWGDEIYSAVESFCDEWPDAEFGPAHIVLSDFNCERPHQEWCCGLIVGTLQSRGIDVQPHENRERDGVMDATVGQFKPPFYDRVSTQELQATLAFMRGTLLPMVDALEAR